MSRTHRSRIIKNKPRHNRLSKGLFLAGFGILVAAAFVGISLSLAGELSGESQYGGAPSISVNQEWIDYGDVRLGDWIHTTVVVENTGGRNLVFNERPYVELKEGC